MYDNQTKIDESDRRNSHWEEAEEKVDEEWPVAGDGQPVVDRVEGMADGRRGWPDDPTRNCGLRCTRLL